MKLVKCCCRFLPNPPGLASECLFTSVFSRKKFSEILNPFSNRRSDVRYHITLFFLGMGSVLHYSLLLLHSKVFSVLIKSSLTKSGKILVIIIQVRIVNIYYSTAHQTKQSSWTFVILFEEKKAIIFFR